MTVSLNTGIDYTQWQSPSSNQMIYVKNDQVTNPNKLESTPDEDVFSLSHTSGCTDGKDDGKIGFFSAIGNAIKGIGKTVVNTVKGMFTDKDGNFSLGKTLLSIGTVALCVAVPAVGVAACAVGATMGAVQVGKGIYNAATAKTDAEAKEAWQNIGGGGFTVATSVVGAKSGIKAVKSTSTAGTNGASALDSLGSNATKMQKLGALGQDIISSTKNQAGNIKTGVSTFAKNVKEVKSVMKEAQSESPVGQAKAALKTAKASGNADDIASAKAALKTAKAEAKAVKKELWGEVGDVVKSSVKEKASNVKTKVAETASSAASKAKNAIFHPIKSIKNVISKTPEAFMNAKSKLSSGGKKVLDAINSSDSTYAQLVQKYGYENVAEVLQVFGGTELAFQNI